MKSKKFLSLLLVVLLLCGSVAASFEAIAANSVSIDSFIESIEELNEEELQLKKTEEDSAGSRVIVKALQKPATFGKAEYIKGTYGKHIFQYATEEEAVDAAKYYKSLPCVKWAERDSILEAQNVSTYGDAMLGTQRAKEYIANHEIPTSSVKVAVIDTGIDFSHEIFKDNPRIIDSGLNTSSSGTSDSAQDDFGHGSEVAEIVMDNTPDDVSIIGYKVLNSAGSGSDLQIATGIEKAIEDGIDIINLSLSGEKYPGVVGTSEVLIEAVEFALSKGVIVICAAGNDGLAVEHFVPACIEGVITVGAIDKAGNRTFFSNYGSEVDFVAPGNDLAVDYTDSLISGTSFSAPYIAAAFSIIRTVYPNLSSDEIKSRLSSYCVSYEHLTYHDGFHPIEEDQGVFHAAMNYYEWYGDVESDTLYYGKGMPQIDLLFEFPDGYTRTSTPSFSVDGGHYVDEEFDLMITSESDAEIYFTQDESYPTKENGIKVEGSIHLDELQSFRAVAFKEGKAPSYFSAEEYRLEYHAPESDFTFVNKKVINDVLAGNKYYYYNVITSYTGTRKNIIFPETYGDDKIDTVTIHTTNVHLTSVTIPDSISNCLNGYNNSGQDIVIITANGIKSYNFQGGNYPSLVEVNAENAESIGLYNNSPVRNIYAPNATKFNCENSPLLYSVYAPKLETTSLFQGSFANCYSLHDVYCPNLKKIFEKGFWHCRKLTNYTFENVELIKKDGLAFTYSIRNLFLPNLSSIESDAIAACGVTLLYAPKLTSLDKLYFCYNNGYTTSLILSSAFTECGEDGEGNKVKPNTLPPEYFFYHYLIDIYGTPNTYAEEYANQFNLKFVALPLLESEPENMGHQSDGNITTDVLGFNLEYQWYGSNIPDNRTGQAIVGATDSTFAPEDSGLDFDYYYCVINSSDGDYHKTLVTGDRKQLDLNGDGVIDIADLSLLLHYYGQSTTDKLIDITEDGVIDVADITVLLMSTVYGTTE